MFYDRPFIYFCSTMKKLFLLISLLGISSCATKKEVIYIFPGDAPEGTYLFKELVLQKGDILDIKVSSINPEATAIFQQGTNQNQQIDMLKLQGYLVEADGAINFPILGTVPVDGMSTSALADLLQSKLEAYVKAPSVKVRLLNYKVSVLGEVKNPGTFTFLEEQITLPQVIGTAGDLTINGDRTQIALVRKAGDDLKTYSIDLTQGDLINPEYFYLQQNDVVYIRPNTAKVKTSGLIGNVSTLTSVFSLILSLTILLTR